MPALPSGITCSKQQQLNIIIALGKINTIGGYVTILDGLLQCSTVYVILNQ